MKIKYNAPIILSFAICSTIVVLIGQIAGFQIVVRFFSVPGNSAGFRFFSLGSLRLFSHAIGHNGWAHLLGNLTFILLIGPILEEKYGPGPIFIMMLVTAFSTGILNVLFFPTGLMGASGVVFMLILLISFTNIKVGEIPLTFILVILLFLIKELLNIFESNNISEFAHIVGGVFGGLFGFLFRKRATEGDTAVPRP